MVSSRLSLCTRTPVGSTPRIATSAMAMTPRLIAISTMVNPATALSGSRVPLLDLLASNEPTPNPSEGGEPARKRAARVSHLGGVRGGLTGSVDETTDRPSGELDSFSTILIQDSLELWSRRLIHTGPAGQPVDANEMVRVLVGWFHRNVR